MTLLLHKSLAVHRSASTSVRRSTGGVLHPLIEKSWSAFMAPAGASPMCPFVDRNIRRLSVILSVEFSKRPLSTFSGSSGLKSRNSSQAPITSGIAGREKENYGDEDIQRYGFRTTEIQCSNPGTKPSSRDVPSYPATRVFRKAALIGSPVILYTSFDRIRQMFSAKLRSECMIIHDIPRLRGLCSLQVASTAPKAKPKRWMALP